MSVDTRPLVYGYRLQLMAAPDGTEYTDAVDFTDAIVLCPDRGRVAVSLNALSRLIDEHEAARAARLALRDKEAAA